MTINEVSNIRKFIPIKVDNKDTDYLLFTSNDEESNIVYGLMNYKNGGKVILKPQLYCVKWSNNHHVFIASDLPGKAALFRYTGEKLTSNYDYLVIVSNEYIIYGNNGKEGLLSNDGRTILPCVYSYIFHNLSGGKLVVCLSKDEYYYYNIKNKKFINCSFGVPEPYSFGYSLQKNCYGRDVFVGLNGEYSRFLNDKFIHATSFKKNKHSSTILSYTTDSNGNINVINNNGVVLISNLSSNQYELINTGYDMDFIKDKITGLYGMINYRNELIIPINYTNIEILSNGLIRCIKEESHIEYFNFIGKKLDLDGISFQNEDEHVEYLIGENKNTKKQSFYDRRGNVVFNGLTFDSGENFKNGKAIICNYQTDYNANDVVVYKTFKVIDKFGRVIFSYPFEGQDYLESLEHLDNVFIGKIMYENKYILFDESGNTLVTFNSNIKPIIKDNLIIYSDDINLFGLYDTSEGRLLDCEYSKIDIISSKYFIVEKNEEQLLCSINRDDSHFARINYINITRKKEENETIMKRLSKFIRRK